jgi:hypothetical protein
MFEPEITPTPPSPIKVGFTLSYYEQLFPRHNTS